MTRPESIAIAAGALLAWSGCSDAGPVTEIVVVVDGDLRVPEELDALTLDVDGVVMERTAAADLTEKGRPAHPPARGQRQVPRHPRLEAARRGRSKVPASHAL